MLTFYLEDATWYRTLQTLTSQRATLPATLQTASHKHVSRIKKLVILYGTVGMAPISDQSLSNGSAPADFTYPPLDELHKVAEREITSSTFTAVC